LIKLNKKILKKKPLIKSKIKGLKISSGRNNTGQITSYHKGNGHKRNYRKIDFYRTKNCTGIVSSVEYDPSRTASIASIYNFLTQKYSYIIAPKNLKIGDIVKSGSTAEPNLGNSLPISKIPTGSFIHNISPKTKKLGQISRSAGTFSYLIEKTAKYGRIKVSSGEQRKISVNCYATLGVVSNELQFLTTVGKAGRSRWLNRRPKVRGVAMNPVDHPHGGGEGKKSGRSLSPWGKLNQGRSTSRSKNLLIISKKKYE
jgi:large subunit ribosomal protein L2